MRVIRNTKNRFVLVIMAILLFHVVSGNPAKLATNTVSYIAVGKNQKELYAPQPVVQSTDYEYAGPSYNSQPSEEGTITSADDTYEEDVSNHRRVVRATSATIEEAVRKVIANQAGWNVNDVTPDLDIYKNMGCDSLDHCEILQNLDDDPDLQCEIPDDDGEKLTTVGDFITYCENQILN